MSRANLFYVLRQVGGWLLILLGIIITPLPIPFGLIMIAVGLALLAHDSRWLQHKIRALRKRYPKFSAKLNQAEPHIGDTLRNLLQRTDPHKENKF